MSERIHTTHVGAPAPERHNSQILDESADNDQNRADIESFESAQCHFNLDSSADRLQYHLSY